MLDETILTERPPLRCVWSPVGQPLTVPVAGHRHRRVVSGTLSLLTGHLELFITPCWDADHFQLLLPQVRAAWRGWHIVMFLDRGSPHTAEASQDLLAQLSLQVRWLPTGCPELNAMEPLWGYGKEVLANTPTVSIDDSADRFCQALLDLSPQQRLRRAGVFSKNYWLREVLCEINN